MEETTYLSEGQILVTSTRIDVAGQTFAVRNVGSVKVVGNGRPWGGLFMALVGLAVLKAQVAVGICVLAAVAYYIYRQLNERRLVLVSGGGETMALRSYDKAFMERVRSAIAQAIAAR